MKKRNIALLVAGALVAAHVGLAAAEVTAVPLGAEQIMAESEPQLRTAFQEQHAATTVIRGESAIPSDAEAVVAATEPPLKTTFAEQHAPIGLTDGSAVPLDSEALAARAEPPLRSTFQDQHAAAMPSQHAVTAANLAD